MPTYEYACTSCGHRFEAVQSFSDPALVACPLCQGPLRKVFGNVGIVLKGSGFYKNDSRSGSNGSGRPTKKEKETTSSDSATTPSGTSDSGGTKEASSPAPAASGTGGAEKAATSGGS